MPTGPVLIPELSCYLLLAVELLVWGFYCHG